MNKEIKNLIILIVILNIEITICNNCYGQKKYGSFNEVIDAKKMKDGAIMLGGEMQEIKDGKISRTQYKMRMKNGAAVLLNDSVKMADGTVRMFGELECINMGGDTTTNRELMLKDCMVMRSGQVLIIKDWTIKPLQEDSVMEQTTITLNNGDKLRADGTLYFKGGAKRVLYQGKIEKRENIILQENEYIYFDGERFHFIAE